MTFRSAAILGFTLLLAVASQAAPPSAAGSVTINGRSTALAHGRAWRNGAMLGVPGVSIILAEKSLAGLDWWQGDSNFSEGQHGVALRIDPTADPDNQKGKEPYRYNLDEDYQIQLHAADYRAWNAASLTKELQVSEITIKGDWVHGKLEWKGTLPNAFDEAEVLNAFSATFSLPLEEIGPMPGE